MILIEFQLVTKAICKPKKFYRLFCAPYLAWFLTLTKLFYRNLVKCEEERRPFVNLPSVAFFLSDIERKEHIC